MHILCFFKAHYLFLKYINFLQITVPRNNWVWRLDKKQEKGENTVLIHFLLKSFFLAGAKFSPGEYAKHLKR